MKWTPRDTAQQLQRLTRYTSIVQFSKYALIGIAVLLLLLVFLIPVLHDDDTGARLVFTNIEDGEAVEPRMNKPRFQGMDKEGRPYNINAESATQQDDGTVLLKDIEADMTLANGSWLAFNGKTGIFNTEANTLFLPDNVEVFHDAGYDLRTSRVHIDLNAATARGEQHVEGQGPLGTLEANGLLVDNEAGYIRFAPAVTVVLHPGER